MSISAATVDERVSTTPIGRRVPETTAATVVSSLAIAVVPGVLLSLAATFGREYTLLLIPLALITTIACIVVTLMDLRNGLALFLVAAGLSPKLPGLYNNLRAEDFIFVIIFGVWMLRRSQMGRAERLDSPIIRPFMLLTAMGILSTFWGIMLGTIPDLTYSVFLQVKRVEYYLIFMVVATTVRTPNWLRLFILVFVCSGAIAAMFGIVHPADSGGQGPSDTRITGPQGENYNTLSGYLVVCIGAALGVLPGFRGSRRVFLIACALLTSLGLLLTFSKEGYIMLMGVILVFGFTRHRSILVLGALAFVLILAGSEAVRTNLNTTFTQIGNFQHDDPGSNSLTARYGGWVYRWNGWFVKQPLIGNGVGAVGLSVDNEYLLRACEVGLVGLAFFVGWLISVGRLTWRLVRTSGTSHYLALGLAAAFVGLLIQGTVATSFTSIRTMEPFWFLLGLVTAASVMDRQAAKEAIACAS